MEKKTHNKSNWIIVFILLNMIVLIVTVFVVFGKYTEAPKTVEGDVYLEDFEVALVPMIGNSEVSDSKIAEDGTIILDLSLAEYAKFTLDLKYSGKGKSYVRVLIEESWIYKNTDAITWVLIANSASTFNLGSNMNTTNKTPGTYLYVKDTIPDAISLNDNDRISIIDSVSPATVTGAVNGSNVSATHVKLSIKLEAVQYNRAAAIWGSTPVTP